MERTAKRNSACELVRTVQNKQGRCGGIWRKGSLGTIVLMTHNHTSVYTKLHPNALTAFADGAVEEYVRLSSSLNFTYHQKNCSQLDLQGLPQSEETVGFRIVGALGYPVCSPLQETGQTGTLPFWSRTEQLPDRIWDRNLIGSRRTLKASVFYRSLNLPLESGPHFDYQARRTSWTMTLTVAQFFWPRIGRFTTMAFSGPINGFTKSSYSHGHDKGASVAKRISLKSLTGEFAFQYT